MGMTDTYTEEEVPLDRIKIDGDTQMRVALNDEAVAEYKARYESGEEPERLPIVYFDGSTYHAADGHHRYMAKLALGATGMLCQVRLGTKRDAVLCAMEINLDHGVRMTHDDKVRSATVLLKDDEWGQWSDRNIAEKSGLSPTTVGKLRRALAPADGPSVHGGQMRTATRGGKTIQINTAGIGKAKPTNALVAAVQAVESAGQSLRGHKTDKVDTTFERSSFGPASDWDSHKPGPAPEPSALFEQAHHEWSVRVREIVYELVLQDPTGCKLLAMIGLDLGDVGQALGEFECNTSDAGQQVIERHVDQVKEALACVNPVTSPLIRRLRGDGVKDMLALFSDDADVTSLSPLFATLAAGWGEAVPAEPMLGDFKPKSKKQSNKENVDESERSNDRGEIDRTDAGGRGGPADADEERPKQRRGKAGRPDAVDRPVQAGGTAGRTGTGDHGGPAAAGEIDEAGGGYDPSHPWYYKLGGKPLAGAEIDTYEKVNAISPDGAVFALKLSKSEKKRREQLPAARTQAEADLQRAVEDYEECIAAGRPEDDDVEPDSSSGYDSAVVGYFNRVVCQKRLLKAVVMLLGESTDDQPVVAAATLAIPEKPDNQASTWHQWAGRTAQACQTLGLDVEQILPTPFAVELYYRGLKPKQAAQEYIHATRPDAPWRDWPIVDVLVKVAANEDDARRVGAMFEDLGLRTLGEISNAVPPADLHLGAVGLQKAFPSISREDAELVVDAGRAWLAKHRDTQPPAATATPKGKPSEYQARVLATVSLLVKAGTPADEEHVVAAMKSACSTTQAAVVGTSLSRLVNKGLLTKSMAGYFKPAVTDQGAAHV